jgi:hypothetical protein
VHSEVKDVTECIKKEYSCLHRNCSSFFILRIDKPGILCACTKPEFVEFEYWCLYDLKVLHFSSMQVQEMKNAFISN